MIAELVKKFNDGSISKSYLLIIIDELRIIERNYKVKIVPFFLF